MGDYIPKEGVENGGRLTRLTRAKASGIDYKTVYGNRRFNNEDEEYRIPTRRSTRRSQQQNAHSAPEVTVLREQHSEDEGDYEVQRECLFDSNKAISQIGEIVGTIVNSHIEITGGKLTNMYNELQNGGGDVWKSIYNCGGTLEDLATVNRLCDQMMEKSNIKQVSNSDTFITYLMMEFIGIKNSVLNTQFDVLTQSLEQLQNLSQREESLLRDLSNLFPRLVLYDLQRLRGLLPCRVRFSGVLDFRPWRQRLHTEDQLDQLPSDFNEIMSRYGFATQPLQPKVEVKDEANDPVDEPKPEPTVVKVKAEQPVASITPGPPPPSSPQPQPQRMPQPLPAMPQYMVQHSYMVPVQHMQPLVNPIMHQQWVQGQPVYIIPHGQNRNNIPPNQMPPNHGYGHYGYGYTP